MTGNLPEEEQKSLKYIYKIKEYKAQPDNITDSTDTEEQFNNIENIVYDSDEDWEGLCKKYDKLPHILPKKERIIAIGDLHGDYKLTINCLKLANLIDDNLEWIADPKDTVVVQIGDQIDRCRPINKKGCHHPDITKDDEASDIKIMELFTNLHKKAIIHGGGVYSLLGNHEILNAQGNMTYVSYKGIKQFDKYKCPSTKKKIGDGLKGRKYAFAPGNEYANYMACTRLSALIIGSCLFVHAGILPRLAKQYGIKDINILVRKWLLGKMEGVGKLKDILNNYEVSPFWPRVFGSIPPDISLDNEKCQEYLSGTLELYGIKNMIIGHTPQFYQNNEGINATCDDHLWRIDTGSSTAFSEFDPDPTISEERKIQVLEIINDKDFKLRKNLN